jgi:hypothetical protein
MGILYSLIPRARKPLFLATRRGPVDLALSEARWPNSDLAASLTTPLQWRQKQTGEHIAEQPDQHNELGPSQWILYDRDGDE